MPLDMDKTVEQFITVRNALKRLEDRFDQEKKALIDIRDVLTARILDFLDQTSQESARTKHGTASKSVRYTATVTDPEAFMNHVITTRQYDLIERRANPTAVREFIAQHNARPPGCNLTAKRSVSVRVASEKSDG